MAFLGQRDRWLEEQNRIEEAEVAPARKKFEESLRIKKGRESCQNINLALNMEFFEPEFLVKYGMRNLIKIVKDSYMRRNSDIHSITENDINTLLRINRYYNIKSLLMEMKFYTPMGGSAEYGDHIELYKTKDNKTLVLSSPYIKRDAKYMAFLQRTGFIDYPDKLYPGSGNAISFYKIYDRKDLSMEYLKDKLVKLLVPCIFQELQSQ